VAALRDRLLERRKRRFWDQGWNNCLWGGENGRSAVLEPQRAAERILQINIDHHASADWHGERGKKRGAAIQSTVNASRRGKRGLSHGKL